MSIYSRNDRKSINMLNEAVPYLICILNCFGCYFANELQMGKNGSYEANRHTATVMKAGGGSGSNSAADG